MFSYCKHTYPAFNMPSGTISQRVVQAYSTGTTTIRTVTKAALFLGALLLFLGAAFLLAWLPASSQAAMWLPVGSQACVEGLLGFPLHPPSSHDGTFGSCCPDRQIRLKKSQNCCLVELGKEMFMLW